MRALTLASLVFIAATGVFTVLVVWPLDEQAKQPIEIQRPAPLMSQPSALEGFYAELRRGETTDAWLAKLYAAALASGVELRAAQYRLAESRHRIERYEIVVPVTGTYAQVRRFLNLAVVEIPVLSVDRASFRRKTVNEGRIEADIVLTLHLVRT